MIENNMNANNNRLQFITAKLVQMRSVNVKALADELAISKETIRRDLNELEKRGIAVRTYGGAVLAEHVGGQLFFRSRIDVNSPAKMRIGRFAAKMVTDGDTVFLDASTTCLYLAKQLADKKITVITNSIQILFELIDFENITLVSTGGVVRPKEMDFFGISSENSIESFYAKKVFFSTTGFDIQYGATSSFEVVARLQRLMIQNAATAIFLCDHSKFGKTCYNKVADVEDMDYLITDEPLPKEWIERLPAKLKVLRS